MRKQLSSCSPNDLSPDACLRKSSYTFNAKMEIAVQGFVCTRRKAAYRATVAGGVDVYTLARAECTSRLQMKRSSKAGERGGDSWFRFALMCDRLRWEHSLPCFGATRPHKVPT